MRPEPRFRDPASPMRTRRRTIRGGQDPAAPAHDHPPDHHRPCPALPSPPPPRSSFLTPHWSQESTNHPSHLILADRAEPAQHGEHGRATSHSNLPETRRRRPHGAAGGPLGDFHRRTPLNFRSTIPCTTYITRLDLHRPPYCSRNISATLSTGPTQGSTRGHTGVPSREFLHNHWKCAPMPGLDQLPHITAGWADFPPQPDPRTSGFRCPGPSASGTTGYPKRWDSNEIRDSRASSAGHGE